MNSINGGGINPALFRRRQVETLTGLTRTTLYRLMADGKFPRPARIAKRAVAWRQEDVAAWLAKLATRTAVQS